MSGLGGIGPGILNPAGENLNVVTEINLGKEVKDFFEFSSTGSSSREYIKQSSYDTAEP